MDYTKTNKTELLAKLRENREAHKNEYEDAHATWKKEAAKALKQAAKRAADEDVITLLPLADLPKPKQYLASYDSIIARLEMEVDETVEVDSREFEAWVLNNWTWKGDFVAGTSLYNANNTF